MGLKDWLASGWLIEHEPSAEEMAVLFAVAALAACGYRAAKESHHYRVIESLALTAGVEAKTVRLLDSYRKKRNRAGYETAGLVSDSEANGMVELAEHLRDDVTNWLKKEHAELVP